MIVTLLLTLCAQQPHLVIGADFTLYRPGIDASVAGATPYADVFGGSRGPLLGGHMGAALPLLRDLTLSLTVGVQHFGDSAQAFVDDGNDATPASGEKRSGGETSISITPLALSVGARWTTLWNRVGVPVIPYAELGGVVAPWSVTRGGDLTAASGSTSGLRLSGGLMVELMGIERRSARALQQETGVSSVVLVAGATRLWLDGFGASDALDLSDTAWTFGLELTF